MQEREREREYVWLQLSAVWEKCFDARCDSHFPQYITLSGCTFLPSATTIQTPRAFRSTGAGESITQTAAEAVRVGWCWWCLLGLCAREEVIPLSKAGLWKYSTLAQMAPMTHVTRHLPFLLDNAHQLDLLYTHIHTHSLSLAALVKLMPENLGLYSSEWWLTVSSVVAAFHLTEFRWFIYEAVGVRSRALPLYRH